MGSDHRTFLSGILYHTVANQVIQGEQTNRVRRYSSPVALSLPATGIHRLCTYGHRGAIQPSWLTAIDTQPHFHILVLLNESVLKASSTSCGSEFRQLILHKEVLPCVYPKPTAQQFHRESPRSPKRKKKLTLNIPYSMHHFTSIYCTVP